MSYDNFPAKFGFESDLRKCAGKIIKEVELLVMEYGCTWNNAYAVKFTDGTRAFFAGHVGTGIMNPRLDGETYSDIKTVETSTIFSKPEYAAMLAAKQAAAVRRYQDHERYERRELQRLVEKFGNDPDTQKE